MKAFANRLRSSHEASHEEWEAFGKKRAADEEHWGWVEGTIFRCPMDNPVVAEMWEKEPSKWTLVEPGQYSPSSKLDILSTYVRFLADIGVKHGSDRLAQLEVEVASLRRRLEVIERPRASGQAISEASLEGQLPTVLDVARITFGANPDSIAKSRGDPDDAYVLTVVFGNSDKEIVLARRAEGGRALFHKLIAERCDPRVMDFVSFEFAFPK